MTDQILNSESKIETGYRPSANWAEEIKVVLTLGIPMGLTQLVQFSVQTVDILMIGRLGAEELAAAALASVMYFFTFLVGFGPVMAVSPLVSQALGADRNATEDVRLSVRMGFWAVWLSFPPMLAFYFVAPDIARWMGQPDALAAMAGPYLLALGPGLPFMMGVFILRNFLAAIDRTRVPLIAVLIATLVNAGLNYLLIFGEFGFPRLELVGAGIASVIAHATGLAFLIGAIYWDRESRRFDILRDLFRPHWGRLKEIVRLGWPMGASMAFEGMFFNSGVFLMGLIGTNEVAAYQVGLNVAAIAFMMPLGLTMAGSVRVGLAVGARNQDGVRLAAGTSVLTAALAILTVAIPVALWPQVVAGFYLDVRDPANTRVLELVSTFLPVAAAFMLFDAIQVAANQALRGMKDVNVPLILAGIAYWVVGFPVALWLGLYTPVGAVGIWYGFLAALMTAAALLGARLYFLLRPVSAGSLIPA